MTDDDPKTPESDEAVRERLEALRRDPDVRWHMSPHTLELAISALARETREHELPKPHTKSRRRRKRKRFL